MADHELGIEAIKESDKSIPNFDDFIPIINKFYEKTPYL